MQMKPASPGGQREANSLETPTTEKTSYTKHWEQDFMEQLYKKFSTIISPLDTPLLATIIEKAAEIFKDKKEIAVLEIGAGGGAHSKIVINGLSRNYAVSYTGIDVSEKQREAFMENSKSFDENVSVTGYTISPWQEYAAKKKYDMILAQHSWYGIGGDAKHIRKLVDTLEDGGAAFVMLSSIETISLITWKTQGEALFSSEDFEKALTDAGVTFEKIREQSDTYKCEDFLQDGRLTQMGKDLCGYLYRREVAVDEQSVIDVLQNAPDGAFSYPKELFIIRK